jgi:serine/threonine protein phosphatase PrpC
MQQLSRARAQDVVIVREARPVVQGGPSWGFCCICDGHGGTVAANYVKSQVWRVLGPPGRLSFPFCSKLLHQIVE